MSTFVPDSGIRCERCHEIFYKYIFITNVIDTDKNDQLAKNAVDGFVNRVTCSFCKAEFTYENPLLLYSHTSKSLVLANDIKEFPVNVRNMSFALKLTNSSDWNLRICRFAMDASEKMRVFRDGLNDGALEILKLKSFEDYRNMALEYEYIVYEGISDGLIKFAKRDDCDKLIESYEIPFEKYSALSFENINIPTGDWQTIDRDWAIKFLEDTK